MTEDLKPKIPRRVEPKVAKYFAMILVFGIPLIYKNNAIADSITDAAMYCVVAIWFGADAIGLGFAFKTLKARLEETKKGAPDA